MELTRSHIEAILFGNNGEVQSKFKLHFSFVIEQFLDEAVRAHRCICSLGHDLLPDLRAAWTESFLFSAFYSASTSCHLLISGFSIPAGNMMRHYTEAYAMALLCSHYEIDVVNRLIANPSTFPIQDAVTLVNKRRNRRLLNIDAKAWETFAAIAKWFHNYSHASAFSLAAQKDFSIPDCHILGGSFDNAKMMQYARELGLQKSSMLSLASLVTGVRKNLKTAQAKGLLTDPSS